MSDHTHITETLDRLGLRIESTFVPWSKSRNAKEKMPTLNYKVTLIGPRGPILSTDYGMGVAHCHSYKILKPTENWRSVYNLIKIKSECDTGVPPDFPRQRVEPSALDVISSLLMDASAIDTGSFEDWCSDLGFDNDSIKAKAIFDQCVSIGLKMRSALGEEGMKSLKDAFQDY